MVFLSKTKVASVKETQSKCCTVY